MRRLHLGVLTATLPLLALSLVLVGCGGRRGGDEDEGGGGESKRSARAGKGKSKGKGGGAQVELKPVEAKEYTGVLRGRIKLAGDKPDPAELDKLFKPKLEGTTDADHCAAGNQHQHVYRIGDNGNVGNVFVWLKAPAGTFFQVPKEQINALKKPEVLDQGTCDFTPRCLVLVPSYRADAKGTLEPTGQKLVVENNDTKGHNTKLVGGVRNPVRDETLPPKTKKEVTLVPDDQVVTIACGIHPYMRGYARAFDHPYAVVSKVSKDPKDPAYGTYEIKGVPVGAKVNVIAWHEKAEYLAGQEGKPVTLEKEMTVDFDMKGP
jgi:hypothetical protein